MSQMPENRDIGDVDKHTVLATVQRVRRMRTIGEETSAILNTISAVAREITDPVSRDMYILHCKLLRAAGLTEEAQELTLSPYEWSKVTDLQEASIRRKLKEHYATETLAQRRHPVAVLERACAGLLEELPKAQRNGILNIEGERYATIGRCAKILPLSSSAVSKRVDGTPIRAKTHLNRTRDFYRIRDVRASCRDLLRKTHQADESGFFLYRGNRHGMAEAWAQELKLSKSHVSTMVKSLPSRKGKDRSGRIAKFYAERDVVPHFEKLVAIRYFADATGFVITKRGTVSAWARHFDLSPSALETRLKHARSVMGRTPQGVRCRLYSEKAAQKAYEQYVSLPHADKNDAIVHNGIIHRTRNGWSRVLAIDERTLKRRTKGVKPLQGITQNGHVCHFYSETDVMNAMRSTREDST